MNNKLLIGVLVVAMMAGCAGKQNQSENGKPKILATTGMIRDAIVNIVRDSAEVDALMGPGVDPHLYKASQGDLKLIQNADVIFYNGLLLEGKMTHIFEKMEHQKPVIPVARGVAKEKIKASTQYENAPDPHIWFDVSLWKMAVIFASESLQQLHPQNAEYYKQNTEVYVNRLDSLHRNTKARIATIPSSQRVLVTAHDAFGYFGDAYDIEVKGLQGISTTSDYGLRDIKNLVDFIISRNIKAVFVETSVSERSINAVVEGCRERGHEISIGGSLYSDAMDKEGTFEGTYIGMVSSNVTKIVEALK